MSGSTALGGALPHLTRSVRRAFIFYLYVPKTHTSLFSSVGSASGAARHVLKVLNNVSITYSACLITIYQLIQLKPYAVQILVLFKTNRKNDHDKVIQLHFLH